MYVLKFGGRSLANQEAVNQVLDIIVKSYKQRPTLVVVSALGETTKRLSQLIEYTIQGDDPSKHIGDLCKYYKNNFDAFDCEAEVKQLVKLIAGVSILKEASPAVTADILAFGELFAARFLSQQLKRINLNSVCVDSRQLFVTDENYLHAAINRKESQKRILDYFIQQKNSKIPVLTGYIASTAIGKTSLLGANGSDYTAAFLASALGAEVLEIWKHVDGICSVDPQYYNSPQLLSDLSYSEAELLIENGSNILHENTIPELKKASIPLRLRNTFKPNQQGSSVSQKLSPVQAEYLCVEKEQSLVRVSRLDTGQRAKLFALLITRLEKTPLLVEDQTDFLVLIPTLIREITVEYINEFLNQQQIKSDVEISNNFMRINCISHEQSVQRIRKEIHQQNWSIRIAQHPGKPKMLISIVKKTLIKRAVELIHASLFGKRSLLHLAVYGTGSVGNEFLSKLKAYVNDRSNRYDLNLFAVANSRELTLTQSGKRIKYPHCKQLISYAKSNKLEQLLFIDLTASKDICKDYPELIRSGFDIVAANKQINALDTSEYTFIKSLLKKYGRHFYYETNVGAALPVIQSIRDLRASGDEIQRIRGVFSGSLSYLMNEFSQSTADFSDVLDLAVKNKLTEPDPREDLSGNDVARKLLILARESGVKMNLSDVRVQALLPKRLNKLASLKEFYLKSEKLNRFFSRLKSRLLEGHVFRYVAEFSANQAEVKLEVVSKNSNLGQLRGTDNIFEIFTKYYNKQPLVIQGSGAGADVTASGVLIDVLKVAELRQAGA